MLIDLATSAATSTFFSVTLSEWIERGAYLDDRRSGEQHHVIDSKPSSTSSAVRLGRYYERSVE
ncbi:hypothetical protein F443_13916 [Phytophthora nicotianae P1569]|uniref:Uncharacterized protein n=2 Tax=Phytophthora nicotianae TaxID=4792 RepID=V9EQG2_PHYNI|nr:hypothetical protein F443_13916 [Phytophthora nicotianae P1569]ETO69476.1 hypothetical protein F444_13947 [Phytophthora nicotianae P1976]